MEEEHNNPVRIVVKKSRAHGGHHGGAWKVAYADFVTAMMALFIVLWILGQSAEVKEAVASLLQGPRGLHEQQVGRRASGRRLETAPFRPVP